MNIFNYFKKAGIDTVDVSFYRKIAEWTSWYNSNVRNFSFYRVYTGRGTYSRRKRKSLGMAKKLSEDIADEEIIETREKAMKVLNEKGYEVVNTLFTDEWYSNEAMKERGVVQIPLCFLAKSLENMSLCHAAYFCKGWENARGCRIEHDAAVAYGLEIIYE